MGATNPQAMNRLKHPFPFSFDGHGVNDANGKRLLNVAVEKYTDGKFRNDQADILGRLGANAPNMVRALSQTKDHLAELIRKDPNAGTGGIKSEHYALYALVSAVLDDTDVNVDHAPASVDEQKAAQG